MEFGAGGPLGPGKDQPEDLRDRAPGQTVMAKLLQEQDRLPPRGFPGRLFGRSPLSSETEPWYKGALGEVAVARLLAGLGPGYTVLHAVPVGKGNSDIDHVVIGPAGVFTLNTKNHAGQGVWIAGGTFMVNGQKLQHVRNSVHEAVRAARLLSQAVGRPVAVAALLVVVDPAKLTIKEKPEGVEVIDSRSLQRWFAQQPQRLQAEDVRRISEAANAPAVWHENPPEFDDPAGVTARFATLHRTVRSARLRRRLWWGLVMPTGLLAVVAGVAIPFVGKVYAGLLGG